MEHSLVNSLIVQLLIYLASQVSTKFIKQASCAVIVLKSKPAVLISVFTSSTAELTCQMERPFRELAYVAESLQMIGTSNICEIVVIMHCSSNIKDQNSYLL